MTNRLKRISQKKFTENDKLQLMALFEPLLKDYKKKFLKELSDKKYNYVTDFYGKFYRNYFYLCAKFEAVNESRRFNNFEDKFARLELVEDNLYNLAYFRHNGYWNTIKLRVNVEMCLQEIAFNPLFFTP